MTSVSYKTLLSDWFRIHTPFFNKPSRTPLASRTGYAAAYPPIKSSHRRSFQLLSCVSKKNKKKKTTSSIHGCASFARFDIYQEGDTDDDC